MNRQRLLIGLALVILLLGGLWLWLQQEGDEERKEAEDSESIRIVESQGSFGVMGRERIYSVNNRPNYSCCEENIEPRAPNVNGVSSMVHQAGQDIILFMTHRIPVVFHCKQQQDEQEQAEDCLASFNRVTASATPTLNGQQPMRSDFWWSETVGKCDGSDYRGTLEVVYRGTYAAPANPSAFAGSLVLSLRPSFNKGSEKVVTVLLRARDADTPPKEPIPAPSTPLQPNPTVTDPVQ